MSQQKNSAPAVPGESLALSQSAVMKKYIFSAIGLLIMFFGGFIIPPIEPITLVGMRVLAIFVGLVWLWTLVDLIWPLFPAMVLVGDMYKDIWPNSWQNTGMYEVTGQSFGNWIDVFIMLTLVLCVALRETGLIRRIAFWFLSTKFAQKGPRTFTMSFLFSTMFIGMFLDATPTQQFSLNIGYEILEEMGYKPGEQYPKILVMAITCACAIGYIMTPICHVCPLLILGVLANMTGEIVNFVAYMLAAIPIGLILFVILCLWVGWIIKPDMSKMAAYDLSKVKEKKPGPMDTREKLVALICGLMIFFWVFPGILSFVAASSPVTAFFNKHSSLAVLVIGIALLGFIHVKGKPLLDLRHAWSAINWEPVVLLAGVMMICGVATSAGTGITAAISTHLLPIVSGFSPWVLVAAIAIFSCIFTNILANTAVGSVFIAAGVTLAIDLGIDPRYMGVAVCVGANLAFLFPSSFIPVAVAYASPWCGGKTMFPYGGIFMIISCIVCAIFLYPMCMLVYGAP